MRKWIKTGRPEPVVSKEAAQPPNQPEAEQSGPAVLLRAHFAEFFGTFVLTLVAAGGEVIKQVSQGEVDYTARALYNQN